MKLNLFIISVLAAGLLIGCSGNSKTDAKSDIQITFTTDKAVGETILLTINAEEADQADVWIDLNNNGEKEEGEAVSKFGEEGRREARSTFTLGAQTITLHGKVTHFTCVDIDLTKLDVTANPFLVNLNCNVNKLTSLDVSQNTALVELGCFNNQITSMDVTNNQLLEKLHCGSEKLSKLTLSNPVLDWLTCDNSSLTTLDFSACPMLDDINISNSLFEKTGLDKLFSTLPDRRKEYSKGDIEITGNPGAETADASIAESKNWEVTKD